MRGTRCRKANRKRRDFMNAMQPGLKLLGLGSFAVGLQTCRASHSIEGTCIAGAGQMIECRKKQGPGQVMSQHAFTKAACPPREPHAGMELELKARWVPASRLHATGSPAQAPAGPDAVPEGAPGGASTTAHDAGSCAIDDFTQ